MLARAAAAERSEKVFALAPACVQVKVITEIRKNENGDRIKVERTVKVRNAPLRVVAVLRGKAAVGPDRRSRPMSGHCYVQITKKLIRVNKAVRSRRTWAKFGDCDGQEVRACLFVHGQGCGQDARPVP